MLPSKICLVAALYCRATSQNNKSNFLVVLAIGSNQDFLTAISAGRNLQQVTQLQQPQLNQKFVLRVVIAVRRTVLSPCSKWERWGSWRRCRCSFRFRPCSWLRSYRPLLRAQKCQTLNIILTVTTVTLLPDNKKPVKPRGGRSANKFCTSQIRKFANLNICIDLRSFRQFVCGPYIVYLSKFFTIILVTVPTVIPLQLKSLPKQSKILRRSGRHRKYGMFPRTLKYSTVLHTLINTSLTNKRRHLHASSSS